MSNRFHVNTDTGEYGRCTAKTPESCLFAGEMGITEHFSSKEEAIRHSEKVLAEKHETFIIHKQTKYSNEDWSKIRKPSQWDDTVTDGITIGTDGYGDEKPYVTHADFKEYTASYMGLGYSDDLPQSVLDLIDEREELWKDEGFDLEIVEEEDDDGYIYETNYVNPPSIFEKDLREHYGKMVS